MADQVIGEIALQGNTKLIFSVSEWRGKHFASVRKFVFTQKYQGPTKSGLSLSKKCLREIILALTGLERTLPLQQENEFKQIAKSETEHIKIRTLPPEEESDLHAVDIREFVDTPTYQGPTKRGIRFRWNLLPEVIACLQEEARVIGEVEKSEPSLFPPEQWETSEQKKEQSGVRQADLMSQFLDEDLKQFPHDFLNGSVNKGASVKLPDDQLHLEQDSAGVYVLKTDEGIFAKVRNPTEANFFLYAQMRGHKEVCPPQDMIHIFRAVKAYENYVRGLRTKLIAKVFKEARQQSIANYETDKWFREHGLPIGPELGF